MFKISLKKEQWWAVTGTTATRVALMLVLNFNSLIQSNIRVAVAQIAGSDRKESEHMDSHRPVRVSWLTAADHWKNKQYTRIRTAVETSGRWRPGLRSQSFYFYVESGTISSLKRQWDPLRNVLLGNFQLLGSTYHSTPSDVVKSVLWWQERWATFCFGILCLIIRVVEYK